jgi:hypothetical protein
VGWLRAGGCFCRVLRQAPGAIDARDHRGERQYAAAADLIGSLPAWPGPPRPVGLRPSSRRMRGVPAHDGGRDVLLATSPGGSLRARRDGPAACGPGCATTAVRTARWPPDRAVDPQAAGVSPACAAPAGAGGPGIKPAGRASRPRLSGRGRGACARGSSPAPRHGRPRAASG